MNNNFLFFFVFFKQRFCAKIALRRAKRVFALIKGGRKIDKSNLEELLLHFDIYCGIFDDAVKQETEINEAEARRLREFRERQVVNG